MKVKLEYGEHCFGSYLRVDSLEYDEMTKQQKIDLLLRLVDNEYIMKAVIQTACENFEGDGEYSSDTCEQCGHWCSDTIKEIKC
jgi:hypothetical protein